MAISPLTYGPKIAAPGLVRPAGWTDYMVQRHEEVNSLAARALGWVSPTDPTYGAPGDGTVTTASVQAAIDAVAAQIGGGTVMFPDGTFSLGTITLKSKVRLVGQGPHRTILQLAAGTNAALLQGENFASLTGLNGTAGIYGFSIEGITFDGNKANNTGGIGLRWYGYDFHLRDVVVRNFDSYGIWSEWCSSGANPDAADADFRHATLDTVTVHTCDNEGVYWAGPPDGEWHRVIAFTNGTGPGTSAPTGNDDGNVHVIGGGNGLLAINCHAWSNKADWAWKLDARAHLVGCCGEAGRTGQVLVNAGNSRIDGGEYFGDALYKTVKGIVLGTAATPIAATCVSNPSIRDCESGAVDFTYSNGQDVVEAHITQDSGTTVTVGTIPVNDRVLLRCKEGAKSLNYFPNKAVVRNGQGTAFDVQDTSAVSYFNVDIAGGGVNFPKPVLSHVQLANAKFIEGTTTGASVRRILGLSSDDNVYIGDIDTGAPLHAKSGSFEGLTVTGSTTTTTLTGVVASYKRATVTYSASMTPDAATAATQVITVTDANAMTINAPSNATTGRRLTFLVRNTSGGAMGAITWNAIFKLASFTNPATANSRSITFEYDGTNWVETGRTTADVPN